MHTKNNTIEIFTDGASKGNPGTGGYGAILKFKNNIKTISGGFRLTTNNRMELIAVIEALKLVKVRSLKTIVYSDSKYIVNAINNKWIFKWKKQNWQNANPDLWQIFYLLYIQFSDIHFVWVKGHNGNLYNEKCDKLAVMATKNEALEIDTYYEKLNIKPF